MHCDTLLNKSPMLFPITNPAPTAILAVNKPVILTFITLNSSLMINFCHNIVCFLDEKKREYMKIYSSEFSFSHIGLEPIFPSNTWCFTD